MRIAQVCGRASRLPYILKKIFSKSAAKITAARFKTYVRSALVRDRNLVEAVHRGATRLPHGQARSSYETRLTLSGLPSAIERLRRGDKLT